MWRKPSFPNEAFGRLFTTDGQEPDSEENGEEESESVSQCGGNTVKMWAFLGVFP